MSNGAELIAKERARQVSEEGWTAAHDDEHDRSELALAAVCYAAPEPLYVMVEHRDGGPSPGLGVTFADPWPEAWASEYDKRPRRLKDGSLVPARTRRQRIRQLVKAGALIAAEIDRLIRQEKP